jgi:serpin B
VRALFTPPLLYNKKFPIFRSFINLNETLQDAGMKDAFNDVSADFSGINGGKDLSLTAFAQLNEIKIGQQNAEHRQSRQDHHHEHDHQSSILKFERQFLYAIRHNPSGMITYLGRYYEPPKAGSTGISSTTHDH